MTIGDNKNDRVEEAVEQMVALIKRFIASSMNNDQYGKAFECLVALREVCVIDDEAVPFNNLAKELKKNNDFFALMQAAKCSLITKDESPFSSFVEQSEANDFLTSKLPSMLPAGKTAPKDKIFDDIE